MKPAIALLGLAALVAWAGAREQEPGQDPARDPAQDPSQHPSQGAPLVPAFGDQGILLDVEAGVCAIPVQVEVRDDLLEYLLVLPYGAAHEALFVTGAGRHPRELGPWAEALNAALLALGVEPGRNVEWVEKDPRPSEEELRAGASPYDVLPPEGDGLYLYAAWWEGDELFFYRAEDLVRDLERGRTLRRHPFVFLGSRLVTRRSGEESFAAALEGNLVNVSFFSQGNTLLTAARPECLSQQSWLPNAWLLPERGAPVLLLFSRERLERPPASLAPHVPTVPVPEDGR